MAGNTEPLTDERLAELDRRRKEVPANEWKFGVSKNGRQQVHASGPQVAMIWGTTDHPAKSTGEYIATLHNAYPALRERLRIAEAERDALREKCRITQAKLENMAINCGQAEGLLKRCREDLATAKRDGAAEEIENLKANWHDMPLDDFINQRAARLREGK